MAHRGAKLTPFGRLPLAQRVEELGWSASGTVRSLGVSGEREGHAQIELRGTVLGMPTVRTVATGTVSMSRRAFPEGRFADELGVSLPGDSVLRSTRAH